VHAWHPYYAGYSENFVRSALGYLYCDSTTVVLDPWGGSGTTAIVAAQEGVSVISLDINPVMATFSAAKDFSVLEHEDSIQTYIQNPTLGKISELHSEDPIFNYFSRETAQEIRSFLDEIPFSASLEKTENFSAMENALFDDSLIINPAYAFCKSVLFVTLRKFADKVRGSNPTWLIEPDEPTTIQSIDLRNGLIDTANSMLADIKSHYSCAKEPAPFAVMACDTKQIPILDSSIDCIITSPPYLTRIDYAISTSFELSVFGMSGLVTHVRHSTMGSPVITKTKISQDEKWGTLINDFLSSVANHPTKAAKSYYWKNLVQYFLDMDKAFDEIFRVLKPGGTGLIVVQSSYFKDVEAKLGEMYVEMATGKGLLSRIAFRDEVKGHLAHVNTRSSVYKTNKIYFEDFVYIEKPN
jgi:SAM-dependent methyltransferase